MTHNDTPTICQDFAYQREQTCRLYPQLPLKIERGKWPRFEDNCIFKTRRTK